MSARREQIAAQVDTVIRDLLRVAIDASPTSDVPTEHVEGAIIDAEGLVPGGKYHVIRTDRADLPGRKHHMCETFVLDLTHDPSARVALTAYAAHCAPDRPNLSADLVDRYRLTEQNPPAP